MTERSAPRVVLLAREGEARARLGDALARAGADIALVADPVSSDPGDALASNPQAVLVALEPAVEDALERFDALLSSPDITVIFDEAELAAQRQGWDAARWVRHLSAKLHRHDDVLPPGADTEGDLQPSPGALPVPGNAAGLDIAPFADEAQQLADEVPRDAGLEPDVRLEADPSGLALVDDAQEAAAPLEPDYPVADAAVVAGDADDAAIDALSADSLSLEALPADETDTGMPVDDGVAAPESGETDGIPFDGSNADDDGASLDFEAPTDGDTTASPGGIELVDVDALLASVESLETTDGDLPSPPAAAPTIDLDALEQRVGGLSLADVDSYGHGPQRGAVLVEGGLGGPDAVRQLLAAIPEGFPRPVLVRLQLDGGRYDRLVKQMGRAAQLPVALAEAGQSAEAGTVYFVPPELSIEQDKTRIVFVAGEGDARPMLDVLPASDSALLLLSGSSADSVDAAMARVPGGLLVAGQALDGCYDATASNALIARGATVATPAELAEQLAGRWPS
ncbi:chemotaxis protein CheB [Luteimonas soli]|uniref:protein-glutamate methylesterase n=1 Tax=Luteimonas soli TaxID=1648966 RepID=A0ABV7XI03_9GAMM